jgi:hypothetical protein
MVMEITTRIDEKTKLRTHKVTGRFAIADMLTRLKEIYSSPAFEPDTNVLWDFRDASIESVTSAEIDELTRFVAVHWATAGKSKAALVVSGDFEFGLSRMYEIFLESKTSNDVMVFRDIQKAMAWVTS